MSDNAPSAGNQQETKFANWQQMGSSETIRRIPHMNRELAHLLGILFTDGCVSPKGKSWRIYFANKSLGLINLFRECMMTLFDLDEERILMGHTSDGLWRAIVNSKEIGNYLVTTFGTFRTLKFDDGRLTQAQLPIRQLLESVYVPDFLRAAFSCDGGVGFYPAYRTGNRGGTKWLIRSVFLACAHAKLRSDYLFLLRNLGIEAREVAQDGKIKIETERNIRKFRELVCFINGTEVTNNSKFWRGYTKEQVLDSMIASYGRPAEIYNLSKFQLLR